MSQKKKLTNDTIALRFRLSSIKDELELFGWRAADTTRYMRDAMKVMPLKDVVAFFDEMLADERAYYSRHSVLVDDQLDHTLAA